jgi:DNA-3-methyladenine glycosylase I
MAEDSRKRCAWAGAGANDRMRAYHDEEWGVPLHDDRRLFEFLCLEGAQAGLSWRTVLDKRENYRRAFHDFDIASCAGLSDAQLAALLADPGLIRNRLKIASVRGNARAALEAIGQAGSLDAFLWQFVGGTPVRNAWRSSGRSPSSHHASSTTQNGLV